MSAVHPNIAGRIPGTLIMAAITYGLAPSVLSARKLDPAYIARSLTDRQLAAVRQSGPGIVAAIRCTYGAYDPEIQDRRRALGLRPQDV